MIKSARKNGFDVKLESGDFYGEYKTVLGDLYEIAGNNRKLFSILLGGVNE